MQFVSVAAVFLYLSYAVETEARNRPMQLSSKMLTTLCDQRKEFQDTNSLQPSVKTLPNHIQVPCGWFYLCGEGGGEQQCETQFKTCDDAGPFKTGRTFKKDKKKGAIGSPRRPTAQETAAFLEKTLKAVQTNLKGFLSKDPLTFISSLLNVAGTLNPWIGAFAAGFGIVTSLYTKVDNADKEILKGALKEVSDNLAVVTNKIKEIEQHVGAVVALHEFKKIRYSLNDISEQYYVYSRSPDNEGRDNFVRVCDQEKLGVSQANWIYREITGDDNAIPPGGRATEPRLMTYFSSSCNYTEILLRCYEVAGSFMEASELYGFCYGVKYGEDTSASLKSETAKIQAEIMDRQWAVIAQKLHDLILDKKSFGGTCRYQWLNAIDNFAIKNKDVKHEDFAIGLAGHLLDVFPMRNWYVNSYNEEVLDERQFYINGSISHFMLRVYHRNLFVAGQTNIDYFYWRNCGEFGFCKHKLKTYHTCIDASEPFMACVKEQCGGEPAGLLCLPKFASVKVQKGPTVGTTDEGWNGHIFGDGDFYEMNVISE